MGALVFSAQSASRLAMKKTNETFLAIKFGSFPGWQDCHVCRPKGPTHT